MQELVLEFAGIKLSPEVTGVVSPFQAKEAFDVLSYEGGRPTLLVLNLALLTNLLHVKKHEHTMRI